MNTNKRILLTFLLSRAYIFCFAILGELFINQNTISGLWNIEVPFFNLFARWDSGYYMLIAKNGYSLTETLAFRPLFPVFLNLAGNYYDQIVYMDIAMTITGFFINNTLFLGALFLIHKLSAKLFSNNIANDVILLLAFYPGSFFFSAIYPESFYLFLIGITFLLLEKRYFLSSGLAGFFAGLARPEGVFTTIIIALKSILTTDKLNDKIRGILATILAGSSILVGFFLAWNYFGDFMLAFSVEASWDKVTLSQGIINPAWLMSLDFLSFFTISLPLIILSIIAIFPYFIKKPKIFEEKTFAYYLHASFLILFFLVIGDIRSLPRYFATIIPVYWTIALWFRKKPHFKSLILLMFMFQLALGTIMFVNWYHFF